MEDRKKTPWFVRVLIVLFCGLLVAMISYKFFSTDPKAEISGGIVTLLCLVLVLVLSESFDNFSIGKIIEVSREVKKKEKEVEKLEQKNEKLFTHLISISSTQFQNQSSTNVYGDYHAAPSVQAASELEVQEKQANTSDSTTTDQETQPARINWEIAEQIALARHAANSSIPQVEVIQNAKLVTHFHGVDPISSIQPIFDAYARCGEKEIFIEFRNFRSIGMMFRDHLYVMLSKLHHYRIAKRVDANLDLVLIKIPGEEYSSNSFSRLYEYFGLSISSGLLKIYEIELSEEEVLRCKTIA